MSNNINVSGTLTNDPVVKETSNGTPMAKFRMVSNGRRKNANGSWEDKPNYFDVFIYGSQVEAVGKYCKKGSKVNVDGKLEHREWTDQQENRRQAVAIVASAVQFIGSAWQAVGDANT
jgi:single-strand DNA-binding protein